MPDIKIFFRFSLVVLIFTVPGVAQRNIVEVPTSEIVEKNHLFFQEQITVTDRTVKLGTGLTWGVGKNFELGFNFQQLSFNTRPGTELILMDPKKVDEAPQLLINSQKGFKISKWARFGIGTRSGTNIQRNLSDIKFASFSYLNSRFSIPETQNNLMLGVYHANTTYVGDGNRWGWMLGIEAEVIKEKLSLVGEYISGNNSLSFINAGFEISLPKHWQIELTAQLPSPGSLNTYGGILQIIRK